MTFESVTDVSIDDLYRALSRFGVLQTAELGYFHAIKHGDSLPILFKLSIPVVGDLENSYGPNWATGTIDYSDKGLTTPPKLLGFLEGISADHAGSFDLINITATSVDYVVRQNGFGSGVEALPLDATFTIIALG
ncbi:hypothetical protein J2W17_000481 [Pseudomonas lini]|uniref:hypothetical protein n=1 Tax=Pseudomonas lini TaxID=163011 RepID=UPI00277EE166|nr:hypothetical protein [Pseudomonas lini]MDQ0121544.1 hypothetical protein [Pseudomonas lini]